MKRRNIGRTNEVSPLHLKAALSTSHVAGFLPSLRGEEKLGNWKAWTFWVLLCAMLSLFTIVFSRERGECLSGHVS